MPHALSNRQRQVLDYIRNYVAENESSPRLDEIATHFAISSPTAHRLLEALRDKGYLYFARDNVSGFFIRLIERAGSAELVTEVVIAGRIDRYGEVLEFPGKYGHFATVLNGAQPDEVFALEALHDIPSASILHHDRIIFDIGKKAQPGDIAIVPVGQRFLLARIHSKTFDKDTLSFDMRQDYPIPEKLLDPQLVQYYNWWPLGADEENSHYFIDMALKENWPLAPIPPEFVVATALRLSRNLAL